MKSILLCLAVASCVVSAVVASPQKPKAPAPSSYKAVDALFKKQCLGCHSGANPAGGYDVSEYSKVMGATKNGKMVVPGKPDKSPLIAYLNGKIKPAMPMGSKGLKPAELKLVSDWIKQGAKNK